MTSTLIYLQILEQQNQTDCCIFGCNAPQLVEATDVSEDRIASIFMVGLPQM